MVALFTEGRIQAVDHEAAQTGGDRWLQLQYRWFLLNIGATAASVPLSVALVEALAWLGWAG